MRITPDNPEHFGMDADSNFTFTLGGYDRNDTLGGAINDNSDINMKEGQEFKSIEISAPDGNDTLFIYSILDAYENFESGEYNSLSIGENWGENCNAFTNSLLEAAGADELPNEVDPYTAAMPGRTSKIPSITNSPPGAGFSGPPNDIYTTGQSRNNSNPYTYTNPYTENSE